MNELQIIEHNNQRVLLTSQIAEAYGTTEKVVSNNFNNNKSRYQESKHFYILHGEKLKEFLQSSILGTQNSSKIRMLYLWTEKGALLHAKSLGTDKAWEVYDMLVETYFNAKQQSLGYSDLSPQLQFMINIENEQKAIKSEMSSLKTRVAEIECTKTVDPEESWKHEINSKIESIAKDRRLSPLKFRTTLYQELETSANVLLGVRQKYLAKRMKSAGHKHREYANVAKIDVIYQNKELRAEFEEIINDMMNV